MAKMVKNLERFRRNFQHKNCSLASLVFIWKISGFLAKYKIDIMLGDFSISSLHLGKISVHAKLAFHMHLEQGNHEDSRLISFKLIGTREASREQGREQ